MLLMTRFVMLINNITNGPTNLKIAQVKNDYFHKEATHLFFECARV